MQKYLKPKLYMVILSLILVLCRASFAGEKTSYELPSNKVFKFSFNSEIDGTSQYLFIKTPKDFSTSKKWPLLVVLHGLGGGAMCVREIDSMIQMGAYGRGDTWYRDLGEKDVIEALGLVVKKFPVDEQKIYLTGFSMGGYGTFHLASRHPDIWAACVPVCPCVPDDFELDNSSNIPFWIHTGSKDETVPLGPARELFTNAVEKGFGLWKYTEHKGMRHSFGINWDEVEDWLHQQVKSVPRVVRYVTADHNLRKSYWLKINNVQDTNRKATIQGEVNNNEVMVCIDNVQSFTIDLLSIKSFNINRISVVRDQVIIHNEELSDSKEYTYVLKD